MRKGGKYIVMLVMLFALVFTAGCDQDGEKVGGTLPGGQSPAQQDEAKKDPQGLKPAVGESLKVYFSNEDGTKLVPKSNAKPATGEDKYTSVIKALIAGTKENGAVSMIPPSTKLRSVEVKKGIIFVNFSKDIIEKFNGGSAGEIMLVGSIVNTLTEFPEIKAVQILVEGKKIETISGHMDTSEPLRRFEDILKN